jgi:hypothetical protein
MLSKMFIKAEIKKQNSIYVVLITYSYYGLYHYDKLSTHDTLLEAKEKVLIERCSGFLSIKE